MLVSDFVGRTLANLGVGHAFGVVGSGNFEVTNALRAAGVPYLAARHEAGAATMADAYARMSDTVAVLTTHQGCGLTNALTGITEAAKSRTPLIALTADTAGSAVRSNFRVDQDALASAVGAVPERIHSAATVLDDTLRAYRTAANERRTVVLNLPLDVAAMPVPDELAAATARHLPTARPIRPAGEAVEELAGLLNRSARPVFVAGRGARHAGSELRELAQRCGALLATSAVANGLFTGDPFGIGISGGFATPLAAELISRADVIVGWGCTLNMWTMRHGTLIGRDALVAQVDVEDAALGANRPIDLGVLGDVGETARELSAYLPAAVPGYRSDSVRERIAAEGHWTDVAFDDLSTPDRIDPRLLTRELDELLPAQRVVAVDSGNFMGYPSGYLAVPDEFGFCFTQAFQSIGLGLFTAVGAALARPDRLAVAAVGDGGFLMSIAELETVVRIGLPMLIVVYNDQAYGAEIHHFGADTDLGAVTFPDTDIAAIARGYGAAGATVRTVADLAAVRDWRSAGPTGPLVIDAKIANDGGSWWLAEAFRGH
ncbi:thiamine pyrophosphate-binding protein [Aldersonia sp. NBC_00410]|uniref:thiamine pyrophosphate-binding protein n=1 Tax=Aldersonia sp. NBC_00410 TaxID=2975954 RepID=UPI00224E6129|nr:thiamine pyrophosphate-binding protein [Aldersonia sp. NBC_00410]MCX5043813.1 thiamine pyrophosphate-binding protein [Aldersonia sp. NBC_00410]